MKKSKYLFIVICLMAILTLTGCGSKTIKTTEEFSSLSQDKNYSVVDVTSQYASYGYIKEATVSKSSDGWQVEFYVLDDDDYATSMFNTNKTNFESLKGSTSTSSSSNIGNYSTYTLNSSGYYMHLCRVDNTLLYVKVNDTYKDEVKEFIEELGY